MIIFLEINYKKKMQAGGALFLNYDNTFSKTYSLLNNIYIYLNAN